MALSEQQFGKAIGRFAKLVRDGVSTEDTCKDWESVVVLEKFDARYLRITRRLPTHAPSTNTNGNMRRESEVEVVAELEDDDPEALVKPAAKHTEAKQATLYDVVYSPSYQVPALYLTFVDAHSKKSLPLPSPDEIYELLVPDDFKTQMRDVGVMGALSMAEHPVTGLPAYFVHPCRTQELMAPLIETVDTSEPLVYMMLWMGAIGASVGLSVPVNVAKLFAKRRGGARGSELGGC